MQGTVLIVDDEKIIRFTLGSFLTDAGCRVRTAENYDAAVAALIANHERQRSGRGQHIDVSAQQAVAQATQSMILAAPLGEGEGKELLKDRADALPTLIGELEKEKEAERLKTRLESKEREVRRLKQQIESLEAIHLKFQERQKEVSSP